LDRDSPVGLSFAEFSHQEQDEHDDEDEAYQAAANTGAAKVKATTAEDQKENQEYDN